VQRDIQIAQFEPQAMRHVDNWVHDDGLTLMYLYGQSDPRSALRLGPACGTHSSSRRRRSRGASIARLTAVDATVATAALLLWATPDCSRHRQAS
jgi:hypothetical protein